jgi:hypothetical protein
MSSCVHCFVSCKAGGIHHGWGLPPCPPLGTDPTAGCNQARLDWCPGLTCHANFARRTSLAGFSYVACPSFACRGGDADQAETALDFLCCCTVRAGMRRGQRSAHTCRRRHSRSISSLRVCSSRVHNQLVIVDTTSHSRPIMNSYQPGTPLLCQSSCIIQVHSWVLLLLLRLNRRLIPNIHMLPPILQACPTARHCQYKGL